MCEYIETYTPDGPYIPLSEYDIPETRRSTDMENEIEDILSIGAFTYHRDTLDAYLSTQRTIGVLKKLLEHEEGLAELFRAELSRFGTIPEANES